jgi:hypothetical protein
MKSEENTSKTPNASTKPEPSPTTSTEDSTAQREKELDELAQEMCESINRRPPVH